MIEPEEQLILPPSIREEIVAHARDHAPRECCGVLAGQDGAPTHLHRLTNVEPGVSRYLFDDEEFFRVYWEIENRGEELLAVYHSHPVTVAYPSETDVAFAFWPEAVYIVCSLAVEQAPVIRGYHIIDGDISEIEIG
ncbi:MAG: M67 family metallopeptidase [Chloroflexota bacterium]|nr:M67 family metallopeptidase [Chloroflexota bacterium]